MFKKSSLLPYIVMALYSMNAYASFGSFGGGGLCGGNIFFCFALFNIFLGIFGIPISILIFRSLYESLNELLCNEKNDDLQNSQNAKNDNSQNFNNDKKTLLTLNAIIAFEIVVVLTLMSFSGAGAEFLGMAIPAYLLYAAISMIFLS